MKQKINYLEIEELIEINKKIGCGGTVINTANLEFALSQLKNATDLIKKANNLLYYIVIGHPFTDGNKRTAFMAMELFLEKNGKKLNHKKDGEYLIERLLYDIAEKRIKKESLEKILYDLIK